MNTNMDVAHSIMQQYYNAATNYQTMLLSAMRNQTNKIVNPGDPEYIPSWSFVGYPSVCCTDIRPDKTKKTNCCNCGAALKGWRECEYCGTVNP